jgi:FkbM family methyltransferase
MRTSKHSSGVAIGSAFHHRSGRLIEQLKPVKDRALGTLWKLHHLRWAFTHPLTADAPWSAINRFLRFRIARHVSQLGIIVPYVDDTKLIVGTDISSAYVNPIFVGLPEFEDSSFVLHLLTEDDLFGDIGANVGIYSVLASGVRGAKSVAIEPVPTTIEALRFNIAINGLGHLVDILEIGIGSEPGELDFSTDEGGCNHVVQDRRGCRVAVFPLDEVFAARTPILLKIDVEGFEAHVIKGAQRLVNDTALKAVVMEMNGSGKRYGFDDRMLDSEMRRFGFNSFVYDPWSRKLNPCDPHYLGNTIYVRDLALVEPRLRAAKPFRILQHRI